MAEEGSEDLVIGANVGKPDVFISHASQDAAIAAAVAGALERTGIKCWMAPRDVPPGVFYADAIVRAIDAARATVVAATRIQERCGLCPYPKGDRARRFQAASSDCLSDRPSAVAAGLEYFLNTSQWLDAGDGDFSPRTRRGSCRAHRTCGRPKLDRASHVPRFDTQGCQTTAPSCNCARTRRAGPGDRGIYCLSVLVSLASRVNRITNDGANTKGRTRSF